MSIEAIRKAKEILERGGTFSTRCHQALEVLDKALAQPEQEPALWVIQYKDRHEFVWGSKPEFRGDTVLGIEPLYTSSPKREWVGLMDDEFEQAVDGLEDLKDCWIQIEAKLKEKNFKGESNE